MSLTVGNERVKLRVRSLDPPGQPGAVTHAEFIKTKRPHAVLVILNWVWLFSVAGRKGLLSREKA